MKMRQENLQVDLEGPQRMPEENSEAGDIVTCPTCGKIWPKDTKFCTQCGTWIRSGKVMETAADEAAPGAGPSQPSIGSSPPGIGPKQPAVGPSPPGIGPKQPAVGPSPPGIGPVEPRPSEGPIPTAPVAQPAGPQGEEPPKKKYTLKIEPRREEHLPQSPAFVPQRTPRKKQAAVKPRQVVVVILCLLAIAYAVISLAFKPLKGYINGSFFHLIKQEGAAVRSHQAVTKRYAASPWAERSASALKRIGKGVLGRHLELQYYSNWTANSTIVRTSGGRETTFASSIAYKAPGFVVEDITLNGRLSGKRLRNDTVFIQQVGRSRIQLDASSYARTMRDQVGFGPDDLFAKAGKTKVLDVLVDDLDLRLDELIKDEDEGQVYVFSLALAGDQSRARKLAVLSGPFFAWMDVLSLLEVSKITYHIRAKDGFLLKREYADPSGTLAIVQTYNDFEPGADISSSRFQR